MDNKPALTAKSLFNRDDIKKKFQDLLGTKATAFMTSVLQTVSQNDALSKCDPMSVYQAAAIAAVLDLPLNPNLGFAYIVPYNQKQSDGSYKQVAQFQMGYKGYKQLALRTGQFQTIHSTDVREGEIKKHNRLTGEIDFEWIQDETIRLQKPVLGFVSYFRLLNGYEQTFYMGIAKVEQHGNKYSKTYSKSNSLWKTDFEGMANKTVTKLNLSKNAPLSVEMQKAITMDQSVINDADAENVTYVDHEEITVDKELERIQLLLSDCKTVQDVEGLQMQMPDADPMPFINRKQELKA